MLKFKVVNFKLKAPFKPTGDQPEAILKLLKGVEKGCRDQVLLGVTGSGKTFTVSNVIEKMNLRTLVISHNKTLAAQLYRELKAFFPENKVCYFVSYYDYYQPEAYIPATDSYIEKEVELNDKIERLRLEATSNLMAREDVIIVASVSAIYNLGPPSEYQKRTLFLKRGETIKREKLLRKLINLHYERNETELERGSFQVKGEVFLIALADANYGIKIEMGEREIKRIERFNLITYEKIEEVDNVFIYPGKHYLTGKKGYEGAFGKIKKDLKKRLRELKKEGKEIERYRLEKKVLYDLEVLKETGYVKGIENYSIYFDKRKKGEPPFTLMDYFPSDKSRWLLIIDESHMSIPQIKGMYKGDRSRKKVLVEHGFRLPSCLDNRPLKFNEFLKKMPRTIYVSATPAKWEVKRARLEKRKRKGFGGVVEQLIRPTGVVDPKVEVRKRKGQIKDLVGEICKRKKRKERVLITTLTKKMAENLADFLNEKGEEIKKKYNLNEKVKVNYLHSEIDTLERVEVLDGLRGGDYDVLVGINLLREGLDLPEVSLVAILDADKEGFLRSETSLIQTMGRAARRIDSMVILYADKISLAIKNACREVERRRRTQIEYNKKHKISPKSISKPLAKRMVEKKDEKEEKESFKKKINLDGLTPRDKRELIIKIKKSMIRAAKELDFEEAIYLRELIKKVERSI